MDSETLAQLLNKGKSSDVEQQLPAEAQATRDRFPLNAMVPLVKRVDGKPSERVRIRNLFKQMHDEGYAVNASSKPHLNPRFVFRENFEQSGKAWTLNISLTDQNDPDGLELLRAVQERLHEISIPMLGTGNELDIVECTEETLPWAEVGLGGPWQDFTIEEAIIWSRAIGYDRWRASNWRETGMTPEEAKAWTQAGLYYADSVENWRNAIGDDATPELVGKLCHARVTPEQAAITRAIWTKET